MLRSTNLFLSWSGKQSKLIAEVFAQMIPFIIQEAQIFFSPEMKKDEGWFEKIRTELKKTKTGIVFLTKENITEQWILFEAGALFRVGSVCVLLCDMEVSELDTETPFKNLNVTYLNEKEDMFKLFKTIRDALGLSVSNAVLEKAFEASWESIKLNVSYISENVTKLREPGIEEPIIMASVQRIGEFLEADELP